MECRWRLCVFFNRPLGGNWQQFDFLYVKIVITATRKAIGSHLDFKILGEKILVGKFLPGCFLEGNWRDVCQLGGEKMSRKIQIASSWAKFTMNKSGEWKYYQNILVIGYCLFYISDTSILWGPHTLPPHTIYPLYCRLQLQKRECMKE